MASCAGCARDDSARTTAPQSYFGRLAESPAASRAVVAIVCVMSLFAGLGSIGPWGIREKRLAACVADIVYDGRWLVPHMAGKPRLEKPPLPYWIIASFAEAAGRLDEWTLRLPGAVAGLAIVFVTFHLARRAGGAHAGLFAALFLASSPFVVVEIRQPSSDLFLTLFTACTLVAWWRGFDEPNSRLKWWALSGLFAGLALLTKGPVVLATIASPIIGTLVLQGGFRLPRSRAAWTAICVATAVGLAWPVSVAIFERDAWPTWLLELDRKIGRPHAADRTPLFYLVQWPQYLFPWTAFSAAALVAGIRGIRRQPAIVSFAWFWFVGALILFSLPNGRKAYYLLPALPGLAVISGCVAAQIGDGIRRGRTPLLDRIAIHAQFLSIVAVGAGVAVASRALSPNLAPLGAAVGGTWTIVCCFFGWRMRRGGPLAPVWLSVAVVLAALEGATYTFVARSLDPSHSHREFSRRFNDAVPPDTPIYAIGDVDPSLWFYLRNRPRLITDARLARLVPPNSPFLVETAELAKFEHLFGESEIVLSEDRFGANARRVALIRLNASAFQRTDLLDQDQDGDAAQESAATVERTAQNDKNSALH